MDKEKTILLLRYHYHVNIVQRGLSNNGNIKLALGERLREEIIL